MSGSGSGTRKGTVPGGAPPEAERTGVEDERRVWQRHGVEVGVQCDPGS